MKHGMRKPHIGRVVEVYDDLTLDADVPSLSDATIENIRPAAVGPIRWTPEVGQRVELVELVGSSPSASLRWVGLAHVERDEGTTDTLEKSLVPTDLDPGDQRWRSQAGRVVLQLEDGNDDLTDVAGRLGRKDADEPLVCGELWKAKIESVIDEMIDAANALNSAATQLSNTATALSNTADLLDGASWAVAGAAAAPSVPDSAIFAASKITADAAATAATTAANNANTVATNLGTLKGELGDVLSDYMYTSKAPEQGQ